MLIPTCVVIDPNFRRIISTFAIIDSSIIRLLSTFTIIDKANDINALICEMASWENYLPPITLSFEMWLRIAFCVRITLSYHLSKGEL